MARYKEVTFAEGTPHHLYLSLITVAFGSTVFALIPAFHGNYTYLFLLLPLFFVLLGLSAVIHNSRKCDICKSRLTVYSNSDRTTEFARHYFHVCEKCKTYSKYSFWADLG